MENNLLEFSDFLENYSEKFNELQEILEETIQSQAKRIHILEDQVISLDDRLNYMRND